MRREAAFPEPTPHGERCVPRHLCCYKTRASGLGHPAQAETTDAFGSLQVEVRRSSLLCAPCTKTLLP